MRSYELSPPPKDNGRKKTNKDVKEVIHMYIVIPMPSVNGY